MKVYEYTQEQLNANVEKHYLGALHARQEFASNWYREAHNECIVIARALGVEFKTFVGIVAALSPQLNWKYNVREAVKLVNGQFTLGYGANISKAKIILSGVDPEDVLGGNKVCSFYHNLCDGGEDDSVVTVDTWALRVATDDLKYPSSGITNKQYARLVEAYREVARKFGVLATEVQAITWVHVRSLVNLKIGHTQLGLPL